MDSLYSQNNLNRPAGRILVRAYWWTIIASVPLLPLYGLALSLPSISELTFIANRTGPLYFLFILLGSSFYILRHHQVLVWTAVFWIPAQSALFFALGPLVLVYGNDVTLQSLERGFLSITENELVWANLLSLTGVVSLLFGCLVHFLLVRNGWRDALSYRHHHSAPLKPETVAIGFLIFGVILKYIIVLPSIWGMTSMVISGFLTNVSSILDVSFAIMAFLAARGSRKMAFLLLIFLPPHVILSALTFSKMDLVVALLFPALGDLMGRKKLVRFVVMVFGIAVIYINSQSFVHHGRASILEQTGTIWQANYVDRIVISTEYFVGEGGVRNYSTQEGRQGWWTRLNYAEVQVAARDLRASGIPNDNLENAWMYFVPRLIWQDKPVLLGPGWFFYQRLTGNTGSFLGLSIYGDLYWLGGWASLGLGTFVIGWLFAFTSLWSCRILRDQNFLMFPLVLLPLQASIIGITDFVVNGILGIVPLYIAYYFLIRVANISLVAFSKSRSGFS